MVSEYTDRLFHRQAKCDSLTPNCLAAISTVNSSSSSKATIPLWLDTAATKRKTIGPVLISRLEFIGQLADRFPQSWKQRLLRSRFELCRRNPLEREHFVANDPER